MGADKRPARSSKVRAAQRLTLQQQSDEEDLEHHLDYDRRESTRLRRSRRSHARTVTIESDLDDTHPMHEVDHDPDDEEEDDDDQLDPKSFAQYNAPNSISQQNLHDSPHDDEDAHDEQPLNDVESYLKSPPAPGTVVTKYGRQVRQPRQLSPALTPQARTRRTSAIPELPSRLERATRRRAKTAAEFQYRPKVESVRVRTRIRQARPSYSLNEDDDDDDFDDDDDEVIMDGNDDPSATPMQERTSRILRRHSNNAHRRSSRKKAPTTQLDSGQLNYETKDSALSNGIARSTRASRSQSAYGNTMKESGAEEDNDRDFPSPGTGEESEDQDLQDVGLADDQDALERDPHADDSDFVHAPRRSRLRSTRTARKTQPRRTVRPKAPRSKKRESRKENPIAREARKSYRPRNESIRPSDYYEEAESSSEESSSGGESGPSRSRPKRAAASRAGDAIANKLDYLQNPMRVEGSMPKRPRAGRYVRRQDRLRPAGNDPFPSDDDVLAQTGAAGIEPIQVDLNLSWDDVGGLDHHVRALKEMVALPLMYPEIFEKFNMEPPKGVLFYGPPGTGKTLCARALAASCGADTETVETGPTDSSEVDSTKLRNVPQTTDAAKPNPDPVENVFGAQPASAANNPGDTKHESNPDVVMTDVPGGRIKDERQETAPNGPQSRSEPAEGTVPANAVKFGAAALAAEHEAVVTERGAELDSKHGASNVPAAAVHSHGTGGNPGDTIAAKTTIKKKPRVAFFMRNGADCLSKWVGEAERQLRMTFEAAKKHQPSIIFFDEIDGLAPVRSSRQDQIHSSIVSTLLGLMDGLDARGKIVVIGATNRVDAIDPALRRPGRFDRELIFTLPNARARRKILGIHTSKWSPPPSPDVLDSVGSLTVGYCGADLKALCTEATIRALRRRYPQIYSSKEKLLINVDEVNVKTRDFLAAMKEIVPASHRSARTHARPITTRLREILNAPLESCITVLKRIFPQGLDYSVTENSEPKRSENDGSSKKADEHTVEIDSSYSSSDDEYDTANLGEAQDGISHAGRMRPGSGNGKFGSNQVLRPRLLICGMKGLGQAQVGPAILHRFEGCPVHAIDYPSLHSDAGSRCAEEALVSSFREAMRSVPAILYLPHLDLWWESASPSLRTTLIVALRDLPSDLPLLVLATADVPLNELMGEVTELFNETTELSAPSEASRRRMFAPLLDEAQAIPRFSHAAAKRLRKKRRTEVLPKAPPPKPKPPTEIDVKRKVLEEDKCIRRLRMEMRNFVETLLRDARFKAFWDPVDPELAPDYYDIIKIPMDITKIASQNDLGKYPTVLAMVEDFDILVRNAIQYNPPNTQTGAAILRRAHGLIDIVHAWVDNLPPALVETCNKIIANRVARQQKEIAATQAALVGEKIDETGGSKPEAEGPGDDTQGDVNDEKGAPKADNTETKTAGLIEGEAQMNGCSSTGVIASQAVSNQGMQVEQSEEEDETAAEAITVASPSDVMALGKLLLDVSTGVTVDGLESLYVRCVKVLRENRRSMNRSDVVKQLIRTATEARDDAAVVGTLVE